MALSRRSLITVILSACVVVLAVSALLMSRASRKQEQGQEKPNPLERIVGPSGVGSSIPLAAGERSADLLKSKAPPFLTPALDESEGVVQRMKAVESAPRANATEALAALRWLLRKRGENEGLRNIVANKLRECGEEHLVSDLTVMLWDEKETPKWRNYCVQQLRSSYDRRPDPSILETLLKAAECDERMVRMCAIWSLARIMTPVGKHGELDEETVKRIRGFSLSALRDEETHFLVREAGIQSCARLGLTEALPDIRKLAGSDETKPRHLRIVAVAALGELKDAEGTAFLEKLAKESTGQLRAAAELALKRIRKAGATEELTDPAGNF